MDASKLRNFLLQEVQSRPIKLNASKLAIVESERLPTKVFQYSDGAIEHAHHNRSMYQSTSSSSSVDSGFSATPNSPNPPMHCFAPAPYEGIDRLLEISYQNQNIPPEHAPYLSSSLPPPLPASCPPFLLNSVVSSEDRTDDESESETTSVPHLSAICITNSDDYALDNDNNLYSSADSTCCSSENSDSDYDGYYDVTSVPDSKVNENVPQYISKLKGSDKTVRSKIKPGTVQHISKLFKTENNNPKHNNKIRKSSTNTVQKGEPSSTHNTSLSKDNILIFDREKVNSTNCFPSVSPKRHHKGRKKKKEITNILERTNFQPFMTDIDVSATDSLNRNNDDITVDLNVANDPTDESYLSRLNRDVQGMSLCTTKSNELNERDAKNITKSVTKQQVATKENGCIEIDVTPDTSTCTNRNVHRTSEQETASKVDETGHVYQVKDENSVIRLNNDLHTESSLNDSMSFINDRDIKCDHQNSFYTKHMDIVEINISDTSQNSCESGMPTCLEPDSINQNTSSNGQQNCSEINVDETHALKHTVHMGHTDPSQRSLSSDEPIIEGEDSFVVQTEDDFNKNEINHGLGVTATFRSDVRVVFDNPNATVVSDYVSNVNHNSQVTMTSGDQRQNESVTPELINPHVIRKIDTSKVHELRSLQEGLDDRDLTGDENSARSDDVDEAKSESTSSDLYNVIDGRKIKASYGHPSGLSDDTDEFSRSDKGITSGDKDILNQAYPDLDSAHQSFNNYDSFSSNLPKFSDLTGEEDDVIKENQANYLTESLPVDKRGSLSNNDIIENVKGVAHVALLCTNILKHTSVCNPEVSDQGTAKSTLNDENIHMKKNRPTAEGSTDGCKKAEKIDETQHTSTNVASHTATGLATHAYLSSGKSSHHVPSNLTSGLTFTELASRETNCSETLAGTHAKSDRDIPDFYTLPTTLPTGKIVTLKEIPARRSRRMPDRSSGYTSSESESSGYTGGRKISTRTETMQSSNKGGKVMELKEGELESNVHVQHLAETIAKLTGDNTDELLPDINQTVTKLPGGNLVITTLTHKVVEEEDEDSPKVPDNNRYIVQDHTGQYYYVEDITDETQESAYYSTSDKTTSDTSIHNTTYDGYGHRGGEFQGIHNLQAVGHSNIGYDTAEEVLLGLYNSPGMMEIQEIDEHSHEQQYWRSRGAKPETQTVPYGVMNNSSSLNKQTTTYEYADDAIKRPVPHNIGSSSVKTVKHSYEMESSAPWMTDGTTSQQVHDGGISDQDEGFMQTKRESMQTTETNADQTGMSSSCAAYMLQSSAAVIPPIVPSPVVPPPVIQPPVIYPPPIQQEYKVAKFDFTPTQVVASTPQICESQTQTDIVEKVEKKPDKERPIFKTVALVKGPYETPKWQLTKEKDDDDTKYRVISSRASEGLQEETVEYTENTKTMSTYKMEKTGFDENSNYTHPVQLAHTAPSQTFRTEKVFQVNGTSPSSSANKCYQSKINVTSPVHTSYRSHNVTSPVHTSYRSHNVTSPVHTSYRSHNDSNYDYIQEDRRQKTEVKSFQDGFRIDDDQERPDDIRVVRGNILIKNTMDQDLDEYNDNINFFDRAFNMSKDNPLYQSDEDLYKRYEREQAQERMRQQRLDDRLNQDITFETVDRFTKSKEVKRMQEKQLPKKNLSQLLLTRISAIDSKDIRQHIDVKHHSEDIYGDINLIHADGSRGRSGGTSNFDSVDENVDLVMKNGKAFITIKVTAERISPIDLEFNVWRKTQAIVTRVIEIDFFANEQRRRLYENVMDRASGSDREYERLGSRGNYHGYKPRETVLSSQETLDLFTEIMDAAEGEGDKEDITVKTSQRKAFVPRNNMDFLY